MGEIADMMLDGTLCQVCGSYLGDGDGFPVTCCESPSTKPRQKPGIQPSPDVNKRRNKARKNTIKQYFRGNDDLFDIRFEMIEVLKNMNKNTLLNICLGSHEMKCAMARHINKINQLENGGGE